MVQGSWLMVDSSIIAYAELQTQEIDVKNYAKKISIGVVSVVPWKNLTGIRL